MQFTSSKSGIVQGYAYVGLNNDDEDWSFDDIPIGALYKMASSPEVYKVIGKYEPEKRLDLDRVVVEETDNRIDCIIQVTVTPGGLALLQSGDQDANEFHAYNFKLLESLL